MQGSLLAFCWSGQTMAFFWLLLCMTRGLVSCVYRVFCWTFSEATWYGVCCAEAVFSEVNQYCRSAPWLGCRTRSCRENCWTGFWETFVLVSPFVSPSENILLKSFECDRCLLFSYFCVTRRRQRCQIFARFPQDFLYDNHILFCFWLICLKGSLREDWFPVLITHAGSCHLPNSHRRCAVVCECDAILCLGVGEVAWFCSCARCFWCVFHCSWQIEGQQ